ncbi:motile sperm domain-containing protein 2 isoform X2 [Drosophila biarmipes]|uniref:motile sperm domain-containing protein 2 isoform X2 n=1 Tax=Drosophila biarmipes TaxID=125945 RepID=UPI0021CCD325|nr:motile sperm domain-containing protein 2 isoform X2 [Drosophila biarmipes]
MGIKVKETTPQQIEELRGRFNSKYASSPPAAPFHPTDIDRIRNDHLWLQRFLEMHDHDMEASFSKLWDTCVWRQSYGANDLEPSQLNQEYLNEGSVFVHSSDVDGKPLLIFRVKLHSKSKNLDELIRIVVYWVERTQRQQHLTQLTIFFDMAGTGLATMDLDFVKRIVETFKQYYPNTLNYILVYELAWVLNAAFKVIKALLPPKAVEILKMISKKDIGQYITKDNCLASWGGEDNYEFSFVPEAKQVTSKPLAANAGDDEQFADVDKKDTTHNRLNLERYAAVGRVPCDMAAPGRSRSFGASVA